MVKYFDLFINLVITETAEIVLLSGKHVYTVCTANFTFTVCTADKKNNVLTDQFILAHGRPTKKICAFTIA